MQFSAYTLHVVMGAVHTYLGVDLGLYYYRRELSDPNTYQYSKPWGDLIPGGAWGT